MAGEVKVKIPSSKKRKLAAVVHDPGKGVSSKLAVLLPGFLDSKDYPHLVQLAKVLSGEGFAAVRFDPTGTWESEGNIVDYTISQYLRDIKAVIDFMSEKGEFEKIVIVGHSLGGQVGIFYAAAEDNVSAVVSIMGSSSFVRLENYEERVVKWGKEKYKISTRDLPENKEKSVEFKVPYSFIEDSLQYDVFNIVSELNKPVLFIAGEFDNLVKPEHIREIYEKAREQKEFFIVKGYDHDYRYSEEGIKAVNQQVVEFLGKYI